MEHTLNRIVSAYGGQIRSAARKYSPTGTDPEDTYQDVLLAVHDRVIRGKVSLSDAAAMSNTIGQRAIESSRKEVIYRNRYKQIGKFADYTRRTQNGVGISEKERIKELSARIRKALPTFDARIVICLAFPPRRFRRFARKYPIEGKEIVQPRDQQGHFAAWPYEVKKWHVAKVLGISVWRVRKALRLASEVIGDIIETEALMEKSWCQLCTKMRICRLIKCDTSHLHPKGKKLTGKQGTAKLSVCAMCESRYGIRKKGKKK